jgi:hypothetical protein
MNAREGGASCLCSDADSQFQFRFRFNQLCVSTFSSIVEFRSRGNHRHPAILPQFRVVRVYSSLRRSRS